MSMFDYFCRILAFMYTILVQSAGHKVPAKWIRELIDIGNKVQQQCEIATNMHVINMRSYLTAIWATIEQVMAALSECGDDNLLQVNLTRVATTIVKNGNFICHSPCYSGARIVYMHDVGRVPPDLAGR
ncbi:hypothetical protein Hdeb2414_s0594g00921151 [Helianthus debilis subsp. tardiflorus]